MRTPRQTKAAAGFRTAGVGLAPSIRTRLIEQAGKRPAPSPAPRAAPPATGPGGVALKRSDVSGDDVVVALNAGHGADLGTVDEWLDRNGHGQDRRAGLAKLVLMHRSGTIGFRAAEDPANG